MGLDFSPQETQSHFSYSGFNNFRRFIARKALGIELDDMLGFGGDAEWTPYKKDVLYHLLDHSDCDGQISAARCGKIATRLEKLLEELPKTNRTTTEVGYHRPYIELFITDLRLVHKLNKPLIFC